jgi:hypothetical protein
MPRLGLDECHAEKRSEDECRNSRYTRAAPSVYIGRSQVSRVDYLKLRILSFRSKIYARHDGPRASSDIFACTPADWSAPPISLSLLCTVLARHCCRPCWQTATEASSTCLPSFPSWKVLRTDLRMAQRRPRLSGLPKPLGLTMWQEELAAAQSALRPPARPRSARE